MHTYTVASPQGGYLYTVTCADSNSGNASTEITSAQAPQGNLTVSPYYLNSVASSVCSGSSQGFGWCWENPLPTGANLRAISAPTALNVWAVGDAGTLLETTDGGQTWQVKSTNTSANLVAIQAIDQNKAYIVADNGEVLTTTTAGVGANGSGWTSSNPTTTLSLTSASIVSPTTIWGVNNSSSVVETTDGGNTWPTDSGTGLTPGAVFNAVAGSSATAAWIVGSTGPIPTSVAIAGSGISEIGFAANTEGGGNWTSYTYGPGLAEIANFEAMSLSSVSLTTANASGSACSPGSPSQSSVWLGGWVAFNVNANPGSYPITFESVGDDSVPGDTATPYNTGAGGMVIHAFDQNSAWGTAGPGGLTLNPPYAVTSVGAVDYTQAGNLSNVGTPSPWISSSAIYAPLINALTSPDCVHGWAAGDAGTILYTADSAADWTPQTSTVTPVGNSNLISIAAVSVEKAYALDLSNNGSSLVPGLAGVSFRVFSTNDGGGTWSAATAEQSSGALIVQGAHRLPGQIASDPSGDLVVAGPGILTSYSSVLQSWDSSIHEAPSVSCTNGVAGQYAQDWEGASLSQDSKSAWVVDGCGDVLQDYYPSLAGQYSNWSLVSTQASVTSLFPGQSVNAIDALSTTSAIIVGSGGLIALVSSTSSGTPLIAVTSGTTNSLYAVSIATTGNGVGNGWAVGANGTILRTIDSGQTWVSQSWTGIDYADYDFTSVSTPDGDSAWVIGQPATTCVVSCPSAPIVINLSNGGQTNPVQQTTGASSIQAVGSVDPENPNTAWIVGSNGAILETFTGGNGPPE
ncbi:MAG TPA: YCF48-related protein [Steroidobacteraceae bacterium]|jgi:photosystem II stability/assembly factor-like uncharacterized protein|nr:YCF48-related protein [Steroidobacteraceae bacterium]